MKRVKLFFMLLILFFLSNGTSWAQPCIWYDTKVVYANGVWTSPKEANDAVKLIKYLITEKLKSDGVNPEHPYVHDFYPELDCDGITFYRQYNPMRWLGIHDIFESINQTVLSDLGERFRDILQGGAEWTQNELDEARSNATAIDNFRPLNSTVEDFVIEYNKSDPTLQSSLNLKDVRMIAVSHSQGNFFSNSIHARLTDVAKNNYRIVSVANPDSFVAGGGPYTTLSKDRVIYGIRAAKSLVAGLKRPLPATTVNSGDRKEPTGHEFRKSYLARRSASETRIIQDIYNLISIHDIPEDQPEPDPTPICDIWCD